MEDFTTPRDALVVFFKHKALLLLVFLAIVIPTTVITLSLPPVYQSSATLLIKFGREYLYRPEVGEGKAILQANYGLMQEALPNAEIEILTSRDLQEKVIARLGIDRLSPAHDNWYDWRDVKQKVITSLGIINLFSSRHASLSQNHDSMGDAVKRFAKQLTVERLKKSDVLRVSFQHDDPQLAAQVVNVLIDLFQEKRLRVFKDPNALVFLQQQVATYQQQLEEAERKLRDFLQANPNFSHTHQRSLMLTSREATETALKTTWSRIAELQKKLVFLQGQMQFIVENIPVSVEPEAAVDTAKSRLLALLLREQELLNKYKDQHPQVRSVRKEIEQAKAFLRDASGGNRVIVGKNALHQDIKREMIQTEAELRAQEGKAVILTQQLAHTDPELQALANTEKELRELQREQIRTEQNYQVYLTKLEETRLVDEMDRQKLANISVVQAATVPIDPIRPRKRFYVTLGVLLGAFAAVGLVFFSEYMGQGLSTPESVERRLGLPVLVAIPVKNPR
jgi:polysaccharide biosynthesis protein PslE